MPALQRSRENVYQYGGTQRLTSPWQERGDNIESKHIPANTHHRISMLRNEKSLHSVEPRIDSLDMVMKFISQFCQFRDQSSKCDHSSWTSVHDLPARDAGRFDCLLLEHHSDHNNNGGRQQAHSPIAGYPLIPSYLQRSLKLEI